MINASAKRANAWRGRAWEMTRLRVRALAVVVPALAAGFAVFLSGCAAQAPYDRHGTLHYSDSLVTGERAFGEPISIDNLPRVAISEPSEEMRVYVADLVGNARLSSRRFHSLFAGLRRDGYFDAVYAANSTLTAAEAFEARGGNCLSYTNMFVALAREAGLDARYQIVDIPPSWDADSGFLIRYTHINVVLRGLRIDSYGAGRVVVDFNLMHPDPDAKETEVSDTYAESLFYANKSVNLLRDGRHRESFAYLRQAIEIAPENIDLWINLGAFYATMGDFHSSIEAYNVGLQLDPANKSAYSGLARSYAHLGDVERADQFQVKVRNYRKRNPYYHYALAQAAYAQADYERSLDAIDTAIGLKLRTARFHLFKALIHDRLGDRDAAEQSIRRAQRFGLDERIKVDVLRSVGLVASS